MDPKIQFEAWMEFIKNAPQKSDQNEICIAFSKLTGSPLLTANRLKQDHQTYHGQSL